MTPEEIDAIAQRLVRQGQVRGYVTHDEVTRALPGEQFTTATLEDVLCVLSDNGITLVEDEEPANDR